MAGEEYGVLLLMVLIFRVYLCQKRRKFLQKLIILSLRSRVNRICLLRGFNKRLHGAGRRRHHQRKSIWVLPRPQYWFEDMLQNQYRNDLWHEHFRVSRDTFNFICNLVRPDLVRQNTNMRQAVSVEKRVAVAIWRLATGNTYRTTGLTFGVGRCTAMNFRDEFCAALIRRGKYFIKFPQGEDETRCAIQAFEEISIFPQVVGALDGSHIRITAPKESQNDYCNRKNFHSIVLQGVADANYKFIHVSTGYAGSMHDARVLRISSLID